MVFLLICISRCLLCGMILCMVCLVRLSVVKWGICRLKWVILVFVRVLLSCCVVWKMVLFLGIGVVLLGF